VLKSLENGWNLLVQDESIFVHDSIMIKRRWIIRETKDPWLQSPDLTKKQSYMEYYL